MAKANRSRLLGTFGQWAAIAICVAIGAALFTFVDLEPKVQADFFFSSDDPQVQSSAQIEKEFGESQQIFVAARSSQLVSRDYIVRLYELTEDLRQVKGVADVKSLTQGPEEPREILEEDPDEVFEDLVKSSVLEPASAGARPFGDLPCVTTGGQKSPGNDKQNRPGAGSAFG